MKRVRTHILILVCAALLVGCSKPRSASPPAVAPNLPALPTQAQSKLQTLKLWMGDKEMSAELALTAEQMRTGMMFRTNMEANAGMLFVLPQPQRANFWMKNCFVPLSAAYLDPDGTILEIHPLQPQNTNPVFSVALNVRYVLETPQGWFERNNVSTGAVIRTERGSLEETFFRRR